jgi:formylglycine-generating enzyme required for sulfatase activity
MVNWQDAADFCTKLSKKAGKTFDLPTEAEWEYACRAGSKEACHYGKSLSSKQANFNGHHPYGGADKGPLLLKTVPVGSYEPNAFGLYDMHGNVWEWCKDWYKKDYYQESPAKDPPGAAKGDFRVMRGGSLSNFGEECRSAFRYHEFPRFRGFLGGFRVVMRLP